MDETPVPGVTDGRVLGLERFLIRTRESTDTKSAWRLAIESEEGAGAIVFVETSPGETFYRGDGIFLGWGQERLAAAYQTLLPTPDDEGFATAQLG